MEKGFKGKIPVLPKDEANISFRDDLLPTFYMSDYSVVGLLVGQFQKAVRILKDCGFSIKEDGQGLELTYDHVDHLKEVFLLLKVHGIEFELSDIVNQVYQG